MRPTTSLAQGSRSASTVAADHGGNIHGLRICADRVSRHLPFESAGGGDRNGRHWLEEEEKTSGDLLRCDGNDVGCLAPFPRPSVSRGVPDVSAIDCRFCRSSLQRVENEDE